MREFAEQEIRIPTGHYKGSRFRVSVNPYTGLLFSELDGHWRRNVITGPTGSGKTLCGFVIPTLYHLFEIGETVICGVPIRDIVNDKWSRDLRPVIEASRYRDLLPKTGSGSQGGTVDDSIEFANGAVLKFMTGGGSDKSRAAFHARVLIVTETDGFDIVGGSSREGDKLSQLEARVSSDMANQKIYLECTVSTEDGRTWQEYTNGTRSRIVIQCPHCTFWVTPERDHLIGWKDCPDVLTAGEQARFVCPHCGVIWDDDDRSMANSVPKLIHGDQTITPDGIIHGDPPRTETLGFRWTATNNELMPTAEIGKGEWTARNHPDEIAAERKMRQFFWALPALKDKESLRSLDPRKLRFSHASGFPRGIVPIGFDLVTVGIDVGLHLHHWVAIAWKPDATCHVIDFGRIAVSGKDLGEELAILSTLRSFRDELCTTGWLKQSTTANSSPDPETAAAAAGQSTGEVFGQVRPRLGLVDRGYRGDVIGIFHRESVASAVRFAQTKGFGEKSWSRDPTTGYTKEQQAGLPQADGYVFSKALDGTDLIDVNADRWKSFVHARLSTPADKPGRLSVFAEPRSSGVEYAAYFFHLTAEQQIEEFVAGKGLITKFEKLRPDNHYLDATALAAVAGHICGIRLPLANQPPPAPAAPAPKRTVTVWGKERPAFRR